MMSEASVEKLYLEDLTPGTVMRSPGSIDVAPETIKEFARTYDPQPFHLSEEAAASTFFKGLAASGWHTAAITMRLLVDGGLPIAGGIVGAGVEKLTWTKPVRPGDRLSTLSEVLEVRESHSNPYRGMANIRTVTINQKGEPVQEMIAKLLVPRRVLTTK
jgi:acyl dehydratase